MSSMFTQCCKLLQSSLSPSDVKVQSLNTGWVIADTSLSINESIYLNRDQQNQHFEQQLMVSQELIHHKCLNLPICSSVT